MTTNEEGINWKWKVKLLTDVKWKVKSHNELTYSHGERVLFHICMEMPLNCPEINNEQWLYQLVHTKKNKFVKWFDVLQNDLSLFTSCTIASPNIYGIAVKMIINHISNDNQINNERKKKYFWYEIDDFYSLSAERICSIKRFNVSKHASMWNRKML